MALAPAPALAAPVVPGDFVVENVATFQGPTCFTFLPDGRMLVGEQNGNVLMVRDGVRQGPPLWAGGNEVLKAPHLGIMSVAVDPAFFLNHYVYFLYTVDPDTNGVDTESKGFGRLVRYQMSAADTNTLDPSTRTVLMGADWTQGPVVDSELHSVGSLRFGADGTLLVSIGDGAASASVDAGGVDPSSFGPGRTDPLEDIGAFRAQYLGSLCGKILRIDPATGRGLPDNPFYDGDPSSVRSRVWQYGLRMPFRITVRPGTGSAAPGAQRPGTLYIGDVGWFSWEEINVARDGGRNFGWPCNEGPAPNLGYQAAQPSHTSCVTVGQGENAGPLTFPLISWSQNDPAIGNPPGLAGNCSINGVFYSGDRYPESYRGRYFFADFGGGWLRVATVDSLDQLIAVEDFATGMQGPVDFAVHPVSGDIHYLSFMTSSVRRIRHAPNNVPVANASASPASGHAPLDVAFSSAGSYDPDDNPLDFFWSFGDGESSGEPSPGHTYAWGGSYQVELTVTDGRGGTAHDTVGVQVSGPRAFPVTPVLDDFNRGDGPIGGAWMDNVAALVVTDSTITQSGPPAPSALWSGASFGPDQEAYLTLRAIVPACRRYSLRLKGQGPTSASGAIEVRYDQTIATVQVTTYEPGVGTKLRGTLYPVSYVNGDRFGARAYADGVLQVFRNAAKVGEVTLGDWAFSAGGGYIGLNLAGATGSQLDDFGGGTFFAGVNTHPVAVIAAPAANAFFADGDSVVLRSGSFDAQDSNSALSHQWRVEALHDGQARPLFTSTRAEDWFVMNSNVDGIGAVYRVWLYVHDSDGLGDTTQVFVFPEVDLRPSPVAVTPDPLGQAEGATFHFKLHNTGESSAPLTRWALIFDDVVLAAGDTLVGARDSVSISVATVAVFSAGVHRLRIVADTLDQVVEVDEANNTIVRDLVVVPGSGPDTTPPDFDSAPAAEAYGVFALIRWQTSEPATGVVHYGTTSLTDSAVVTAPPDTAQVLTVWGLHLGTRYYYRVTVIDPSGNRAQAPRDSFVTKSGPLTAPGAFPRTLELSNAIPNPSTGVAQLELALPRSAPVRFQVFDVLGREVWSAPDAAYDAGRWPLRWAGTHADGRRVHPGVYLARVRVGAITLLRRIAIVR